MSKKVLIIIASAAATLTVVVRASSVAPKITDATWNLEEPWTKKDGLHRYSASSQDLSEKCALNSAAYVVFPRIIEGAHEIYGDGRLLYSFGSIENRRSRSTYGTAIVQCQFLLNVKQIRWKAATFSADFAKIRHLPFVSTTQPHDNFFAELMNALAVGALFCLAIFYAVVFYGKVPHTTTMSLSLSSLFFSFYCMAATASMFNIKLSMLAAHRLTDINMWLGAALMFYALKIQRALSVPLYWLHGVSVAITIPLLLAFTDGDTLQNISAIPFPATILLLVWSVPRLAYQLYVQKGTRGHSKFQLASMILFAGAVVNDIGVVSEVWDSAILLPFGLICGSLFVAFSVHESIMLAYKERDFLRSNLENEVKRQTSEIREQKVQLQTTLGELKATQAELVQSAKMASLGTLSAGIAHEINNSINYVNGALPAVSRLGEKLTDTTDRQKFGKLVEVMRTGLDLTVEIIKSLRNYSRLNQSKVNEIKILDVVNTVSSILRSKLKYGVNLEINIPAEMSILCNVVGLNEVLMNLIVNAIDAMPNGGNLNIFAKDVGQDVEITVKDTGEGMSQETMNRIFEPFFTTKQVGKGTGLGLHICKKEIEQHGGTIKVESILGKGTTFTVTLPKKPILEEEGAQAA